MHKLNIAFLGTTAFSRALLGVLIAHDYVPKLVFTMPETFDISYADGKQVKNYNHVCLRDICDAHDIPCYEVARGKKTLLDYQAELLAADLDVMLVMGWFYMVPQAVRDLSRLGAWGIHASMLPDYAGGAPLVWAIINGEKETGVTLFRLDDGVDDGDIIAQERILIDTADTIKEVCDKVTGVSETMLLSTLGGYPNIKFVPQEKEIITVYPQRKPEDGALDLTLSSMDMYNFIRAQSSPYPGAFIRTSDGKKLIIEKARIEDDD
jgi:methionyl-tRNA formyltransferase